MTFKGPFQPKLFYDSVILCCKCSPQFESLLMVQDCSAHTGGLCSSENQSLLQTFVPPCGLEAPGAYLEPQLLVPFFPKDFICGSHTP